MKEERFPHTRKPLHWWRRWGGGAVGWWGGGGGGKFQSRGGERGNRGAEGKAERLPHRGAVPTSTHQPERLVCSPAEAGGAGS